VIYKLGVEPGSACLKQNALPTMRPFLLLLHLRKLIIERLRCKRLPATVTLPRDIRNGNICMSCD